MMSTNKTIENKKGSFLLDIKYCLLLLAVAFFCGCAPKSNGYENLDVLYTDFVAKLKQGGGPLKDYCFKITPDAGTVDYMEKKKFSYRGIPEELKKQKIAVSEIGKKYFEQVSRFREGLIAEKQLDDLSYIGREKQGEELFNKELGIYATETFILLRSGSDTIRCKLGEMFKIDGKWKSFTTPKLGW